MFVDTVQPPHRGRRRDDRGCGFPAPSPGLGSRLGRRRQLRQIAPTVERPQREGIDAHG
jgi:hypothetical protein